MHVVLGLLGALVTVFYLLDRLGVDIGGVESVLLVPSALFRQEI